MFANLIVPSCTFPLSMVLHGQLCKLAGGMRERDTSHLPTPVLCGNWRCCFVNQLPVSSTKCCVAT